MVKSKIISYLKSFFRSFIWLFILLLALDIITKQLVLSANVPPGSTIYDWGIVRISFVLNNNAAFGIGFEDPQISRIVYLVASSIITIAILIYLIVKRKETKLIVRASLVLVITGAIGNMIDRIFYGPDYAVVDWIDFYWFWPFNFNIADSCIVVGTFMLIIYVVIYEVKDMIKERKLNEEKTLSTREKERLAEQDEEKDK